MERSYIAFISYKHTKRDAAIAKQVHSLIENYVIPKLLRKNSSRKLGIVFRDEEELPISSNLTDSICTALDSSRYLIVICSPESKASIWVSREVSHFLKKHDSRNVFVVLVKGDPADVFPSEITHVLNEETGEYQDVEPLAMDVRADTIDASLKKTKQQIKKLYAGMLGCTYDSLVQREKTRRLKRFMAVITFCVLLAGCFIGMLLFKNQELSQANDRLTAAIELALDREAGLLVEQADEALQEGDVASAIRYASDALYSEDIERPYYAPAERMLFASAAFLQKNADSVLLSKVELRHLAPIEMMAYNSDGSIVYTIDMYGKVSSFDAFSGDLLWNAKFSSGVDSSIKQLKAQLMYNAENDSVICCYDKTIAVLDSATGQIFWRHEFDHQSLGNVIFDVKGQQLACIENQFFYDPSGAYKPYNKYDLVVLSAADGRLLNRISLAKTTSDNPILVTFGRDNDISSCGTFAGSSRFAGFVFKTENAIEKALLFTADLSNNTVNFTENESFPDDSQYRMTFYIGNDRMLIVSSKSAISSETGYLERTVHFQCFDLNTGSLLWEEETTVDKYISPDSRYLFISGQTRIVVSIAEHLYIIDRETGEILGEKTFDSEIIHLHEIVDGLYSFSLANGYCAAIWRNNQGLHDSKELKTSIDLPDTPKIIVYNNGLIQAHITENSIDHFSMPPLKDGGGSVTYLSEDRCTAYVTTALAKPALPEAIPVSANADDLGTYVDINPQGTALLAQSHTLNIVDTENHSCETIRLDDEPMIFSPLFFLTADGETVLMCAEDGRIRRIDMDGTVVSLAENERITLKTVYNTEIVDDIYRADATRQVLDGRIVIARSDGQQLSCWTDGSEETSVPLPAGVKWSFIDNAYIRSMLHVGENGLLVLSDFASGDVPAIENFAVYDLNSQKWKLIPDAAQGSDERLVVFGESSPVFAVYDEDMNIRVYNWNVEEPVCCLQIGHDMYSVLKVGMLLDDQYIYVYTKDGQFMVYCLKTNETAYRTIFNDDLMTGRLSCWHDRENERLYLQADGNDGICIDVRSWKQLFTQQDSEFYCAARNEIYTRSYDPKTASYQLKALQVPTTSELLDFMLNTLQGENTP